jgi:hypothetical protein
VPTTAPERDCDPSYPDVCLDPDAADYDCAGGSGNGPEYVDGPLRVRPPDPFDLDREGDGWGCESGERPPPARPAGQTGSRSGSTLGRVM